MTAPGQILPVLILIVGAYLLGSVNSAVWVAKAKGVNIYTTGSGNPGASNVFRSIGKGAAALVYLGDLAKGFVPALVGSLGWGQPEAFAAGFFAVLGHCWPVFHRFRGGKGVATAGGALLATVPLVVLGLGVAYGVLVSVTKISSVGSLSIAALALPVAWFAGVRGWGFAWLVATILLIVYRHSGNIARLLGGSENKVVTHEQSDQGPG